MSPLAEVESKDRVAVFRPTRDIEPAQKGAIHRAARPAGTLAPRRVVQRGR